MLKNSNPVILSKIKLLGLRKLSTWHTRKKAAVDPPRKAPYLILVCFARSSADSMGESIRSTVRNAARFAVYDEIIIKVKNHHIPATIRVETALKYLNVIVNILTNNEVVTMG